MQFENGTDLASLLFRSRDAAGLPSFTCIAKATYAIDDRHESTRLRRLPASLCLADEHYDDSARASLRVENDLAPHKRRADIYFIDPVARAPGGSPSAYWAVSVQVGSLNATLHVTGKRSVRRSRLGSRPSPIEPVERVPVRFELAYGGTSKTSDGDMPLEENPVGTGYSLAGRTTPGEDVVSLPQVFASPDDARDPLRPASPISLCPVHRAWKPRRLLAGTFDDRWSRSRWPLLPEDFRPDFYNAAPRPLQYAGYLKGNEPVRVVGLSGRPYAFRLPVDFDLALILGGEGGEYARFLRIDTLAFDLAREQIHLSWRALVPAHLGGSRAALVQVIRH